MPFTADSRAALKLARARPLQHRETNRLYFKTAMSKTRITISTTMVTICLLSPALRAILPTDLRARSSLLWCRSTRASWSSSMATWSSSSSPMRMLSSRCRPMLSPSRSSCSSCSASTALWYAWICTLSWPSASERSRYPAGASGSSRYGWEKRAAALGSSAEGRGEEKRTDLLPAGGAAAAGVVLLLRRDFLAGEGPLVLWLLLLLPVVSSAWAKSSARVGSLGCVRVAVVPGEEKPWNCDVRSSSCFCRPGRVSARLVAFLHVSDMTCQR